VKKPFTPRKRAFPRGRARRRRLFPFHPATLSPASAPTPMAKAHPYKFCFGPWNISEGQDPYGPPVRQPQTFEWKLAQLKKHGFDAMMFHDDDAVLDLDGKSAKQIAREARELKRRLDGLGIAAEMVAPRLWFAPQTVDGGYTSKSKKDRKYAIDRSKQTIDIARVLGTDLIVLWLAREGTYIREAKSGARSTELLVQALDAMLAHDKKARLCIEPKPNEPMDHAYIPSIGHALAIASLTRDPKRVGALIESAHAILAGFDPADEIDFAMSFGKLWSLHLNDQNGLKFDQDKPFGSANLRVAFNQVRALERNGYGKRGEYVCFDVHPFRTTKEKHWLDHLTNSRRTFLRLLDKVRSFDERAAQALIADRNYQALDQMVIEHLMGK
jgi:xylose isomerase